MYLLGYDIGSSSVKASMVEAESGRTVASAFYPKTEATISSVRPGWAEQNPEDWWTSLKAATAELLASCPDMTIDAIGISYQMHGLVCVGKDLKPLRPAIIWCDSRAVPYGNKAFEDLGRDWCLGHLLNSPGNFTASKLAWVKENEPDIFSRIYKVMLPGDYIAMKMTGELCTTVSGLSEGMMWDFAENRPATRLMEYFGFSEDLLPGVVPVFGEQGRLSAAAAAELGLPAGIRVTYRAGDQPNNALSLNVLNPGEIAATAGTSGVVYGVLGEIGYDPESRVNTFAHVNHTAADPRLGVLLCINGTGILNSWMRRNVAFDAMTYPAMNAMAAESPIGSRGISILPFGNGAERLLGNTAPGCSFHGIDFNRHGREDLLRAAQEGIAFSFCYGMEVMQQMGMKIDRIHAGNANMFLSGVFRETLSGVSGAMIELFDTDGSVGAARGAGLGAGIYAGPDEAFASTERLALIAPPLDRSPYLEAYSRWLEHLSSTDSQIAKY